MENAASSTSVKHANSPLVGLTSHIRDVELRFLVNCFLQLSLIPYFHILPIGAANQPVGALIAGMAMLLGFRLAKIPVALLICVLLAVVYLWTVVTLVQQPSHAGDIVQETAGYFATAITFIFALNYQRLYSRGLLRLNLLVLTAIGLIQAGALSRGLGTMLDTALSHIVTDMPTTVSSSRGVPLLTSEPSFAAQALSLYFYLWLLRDFPGANKMDRIVYGTCFLLLFATNASGTLVVFIAASALVYILFSGRRAVLSLLSIIPLGGITYGLLVATDLMPSRLKILFSILPTLLQIHQASEIIIPLTLIAGFRAAVILIGLGTPLVAPFGNGIAQWSWGLLDVAYKFGIDFRKLPLSLSERKLQANKPNSFVSTFVYETGWVAYAVMTLFLLSVWRAFWQHRREPHFRLLACAIAIGLVQICVNGLAFLSSPWLLVAMAYQRPETWRDEMIWRDGQDGALSS